MPSRERVALKSLLSSDFCFYWCLSS